MGLRVCCFVRTLKSYFVLCASADVGMEKCGKEAGRKTASDSGISQSVILGSVFRSDWLLVNSGNTFFGEKNCRSTVGHAGIVQSMALLWSCCECVLARCLRQ